MQEDNLIEIYQDYIDEEGYVQRYNYDKGRYYNTGTCLRGPKGNCGNPGRPGKDGLTPRINQDNGHWMIGDVDTGVMAVGGQSDWNQNDNTKLDYIKNKPTISSGSVILNDSYGAFDLSVHNAVNGVPTTYANLSAALTALNALDSTYKKPGMSFRFVRSSDNKYVQYRYMGTATTGSPNPFLDTANWQGVDDEPTAGSKNLVKSGGVDKRIESELYTKETRETTDGPYTGTQNQKVNLNKVYPKGLVIKRLNVAWGQGGVIMCDANGTRIDSTVLGYGSSMPYTLPENAYKIEFRGNNTSGISFVFDEEILKPKLDDIESDIDEINEQLSDIHTTSDKVLDPETNETVKNQVDFLYGICNVSKNIPFQWKNNAYITWSNGTEWADNSVKSTDYIEVEPCSEIMFLSQRVTNTLQGTVGIAFYDEEKNYLSGIPLKYQNNSYVYTDDVVSIPADAKYMRTFISQSHMEDFYIKQVLGNTPTITFTGVTSMKKSLIGIAVDSIIKCSNLPSSTYSDIGFELTRGARGMWISCQGIQNSPYYAIVDKNSKVIYVSEIASANTHEKMLYVNLQTLTDAAGVYFCKSITKPSYSKVIYDYEGKNKIYSGDIIKCTTDGVFQSATKNGNIYSKVLVPTSNTVTIECGNAQLCGHLGIMLKAESIDELRNTDKIRVRVHDNNGIIVESRMNCRQLLQSGEWVIFQICPVGNNNPHFTNYVKSVVIEIDVNEGSSLHLQFYDTIIFDKFNRPVLIVNFDSVWSGSAEAGVYDYMRSNGIPYTITGGVSGAGTTVEDEILNDAKNGLVDLGKYGGQGDPAGTGSTYQIEADANDTFGDMITKAYNSIEIKTEQNGIMCSSYGTGGHRIKPKMLQALLVSGFRCVRVGNNVQEDTSCICANVLRDGCLLESGVYDNGYYRCGAVGTIFAHGLSYNPSQESDPTVYTQVESFYEKVDFAKNERGKGGCLIINMKQYVS